jgi:thymidylate synthase ThyX
MKVSYVDHMGNDLSVVNAARVSFGKRSDTLTERDRGLIRFLARGCTTKDWDKIVEDALGCGGGREALFRQHPDLPEDSEEHQSHRAELIEILQHVKNMPTHWTPFGHTAITLHIKAPIFVARQLGKHQVGMVWNEVSRRYVTEEPEFYQPDVWRTAVDNVKQGSSTEPKPHPEFTQGFCINCGSKITQATRHQGGGRVKKYCGSKCKSEFTNRNRDPYKAAFQNAKARVKREGARSWNLNHEDMIYPEYCPYLGIKLDYSFGKGRIEDDSPSFDRVDNSGDYTHDNVQVISHLANSMKNSATKKQQVAFAKKVLLMHEGYVADDTRTYKGLMKNMVQIYDSLIDSGYPAEQARMILPQATMTEWFWTGNLYSFANVFIQRTDSHAQRVWHTRSVTSSNLYSLLAGLHS